ncbi:MAG: cation:proton antiporter [Pseudomonadota bacterium]|nr:cation:proton antiporter [Pseudomonadota bacterium]
MYENLAILAAFVFLYSIVSGGLERTPINGAVVFAAFGLAFGPLGLGVLSLTVDTEGLRSLAELTLALVLFTDAANANLGVLKQSFHIPQRLLLIGLPLTILLGFGVGVLVFDGLTLVEIAILATMLAPTDAALGKAVVTNESVPSNIREGLNVESGLNDGICVPILFAFLALAAGSGAEGGTSMLALKLVAEEIGIGIAVGVGLTVLGSWLLKLFADRRWITEAWQQVPVPALAVACFAVAQWLGGSGFIAAFAGGLLFGALVKHHKPRLMLAAEGTGDTLALVTWVVFGAAVVGQAVGSFSWEVVLYALLSLTLVRMLPVFLVLAGMKLQANEKLFMGWFGPRGLASIVFAVIVFNEHLPGGGTITMTVVCTIVLSVIAHGISANPLVAALVSRINHSDGKTVANE